MRYCLLAYAVFLIFCPQLCDSSFSEVEPPPLCSTWLDDVNGIFGPHGGHCADVAPSSLLQRSLFPKFRRQVRHSAPSDAPLEAIWAARNFSALTQFRAFQGYCRQVVIDSILQAAVNARMLFDSETFRVYGREWTWFGITVVLSALVNRRLLVKLRDNMTNNFVILLIQLVIWSVFAARFAQRLGPAKGLMWVHGYFLDWMLSFDSVFLFHAIFRHFRTPRCVRYNVLTACLCTAACCRVALFFMLESASTYSDFARPFTGVALVGLGLRASLDDEHYRFSCQWTLMMWRWLLGSRCDSSPAYDEQDMSFLGTYDGHIYVTFFGFVAVVLEFLDCGFMFAAFAAKVMQIPDVFILSTSSVAAMFCMRALYSVIQDSLEYLFDLKYVVCGVYVFTGMLTLLQRWVLLDEGFVFSVNILMFLLCMLIFALWQGTMLHRTEDVWFGVFEGVRFEEAAVESTDIATSKKSRRVNADIFSISDDISPGAGILVH